jgi:hypothetical protein
MAAAFGAMISRAIDMHEPNQSRLLALYRANANLYGLLNAVTIAAFGFLIAIFWTRRAPDMMPRAKVRSGTIASLKTCATHFRLAPEP